MDSDAAYQEHCMWLQSMREDYQLRASTASVDDYPSALADLASGERRNSFVNVDEDIGFSAQYGEDPFGSNLTAEFGGLNLEGGDFDEGPVYRSLSIAGASGDFSGMPTSAACKEPACLRQTSVEDTVDAQWLRGANPPLIRRQRAFDVDR
eukprot:6197900-Pleurochrysis_carterae.AAC.1